MKFVLAVIVVGLGLANGAQASTIEEATGAHYQHDGEQDGDASDDCTLPDPDVKVDRQFTGTLVPIDDPEDNYGLKIQPIHVNQSIRVRLDPAPALNSLNPPLPDYDLNVWAPGCDALLGFSHQDGSGVDEVVFMPNATGKFVVQITEGDGFPLLVTKEAACHSVCVVLINQVVGYVVRTCVVGTVGC